MPGLVKGHSNENLSATSTRSSQHHSGEGNAATMPCSADDQRNRLPAASAGVPRARAQTIERLVDEDSGHAQTLVHNADGTCMAFGENSVVSLCESEELEARKLIDSLTDLELQGLVHEFNQRLLKTAKEYEELKRRLDLIAELADLAFFGLTQSSTEKDLDQAYRRLAKIMHPDKNGDTEEAKAQFQDMKKRYERLKPILRKRDEERLKREEAERNRQERSMKVEEECQTSPVEEVAPQCPEAAIPAKAAKEEEPIDREELDEACWKLLRRTKAFKEKVEVIHQQIDDTHEELQEYQSGEHLGVQRSEEK